MVDQVWHDRWQALDNQMAAMETSFLQLKNNSIPHIDTLCCLIQCLRVFAAGQFNFFWRCFGTGGPYGLQRHEDYPLEHVFRGIISQISHDVHVIQRAANQRKMASGLPQMQTALDTAEKLAWDALQPAMPKLNAEREVVESGLLEKDTTVFVYFEKLQSIRIIPYAPVALIAVNFTTMNAPQDYLAIPHEVGHYVFRRGKEAANQGALRTLLREETEQVYEASSGQKNRKYIKSWAEEIFADVYGCLVAGPVMALDFQNLQLEEKPEDFITDDDKHATPILRPYIYTQALHRDNSHWATASKGWAGALKTLWDARRTNREKSQGRKSPPQDKPKDRLGTFCLSNWTPDITVAISPGTPPGAKPIDQIIGYIIDNLLSTVDWPKATWWTQTRSTPSPSELTNLAGVGISEDELPTVLNSIKSKLLCDTFNNRFSPGSLPLPDSKSPPELQQVSPRCDTTALNGTEGEREARIDTLVRTWPQPFFTVDNIGDIGPDGVPRWVDVWLADGWNTHGNGRWLYG